MNKLDQNTDSNVKAAEAKTELGETERLYNDDYFKVAFFAMLIPEKYKDQEVVTSQITYDDDSMVQARIRMYLSSGRTRINQYDVLIKPNGEEVVFDPIDFAFPDVDESKVDDDTSKQPWYEVEFERLEGLRMKYCSDMLLERTGNAKLAGCISKAAFM